MMELTMSLSFSLSALTALFRETEACVMTSSMSLSSMPEASTSSSSSSSSSSFFSSAGSLPLASPAAWPAVSSAAACWASWEAAACWAAALMSSILASPKTLRRVSFPGLEDRGGAGWDAHVGVAVGRLVDLGLVDDEEDLPSRQHIRLIPVLFLPPSGGVSRPSTAPDSRSWGGGASRG